VEPNANGAAQLQLSLQQLTHCIDSITAKPADSFASLHECAASLVRTLNDSMEDPSTGEPAATLVRLFMTVPHGGLDEAAAAFVAKSFPDLQIEPDTKCLTLMGSVGDEPDWCTIEGSRGHQAIPLLSEEGVQEIPMIARLLSQLGLEVHEVLAPAADLAMKQDNKTFNVFHVEDAVGSSYIPAQDEFVVPRGVKSVLGFGSMLPSGHLCVVIIFSKVKITADIASLFRPLALGVRMAVLPYVEDKIIGEQVGLFEEIERLRAVQATQAQLLTVFQDTVVEQSDKLDGTLTDLQSANTDLTETLGELREARSQLMQYEERLIRKYAIEKLRDPATYRVAFTVGTLINGYGHFLVPYMRGRPDVLQRFMGELEAAPHLVILSIVIAYLFPIIVQVHSAVRSRVRTHATELRAEFPNNKPDPVFRAAPDGRIIDAGAATRELLQKHSLTHAQVLLGQEIWGQIVYLQHGGERLPLETTVHVGALERWYVVGHAPSASGGVNVYLTAVAAPS
jgi:hypothetical protein